MELLNTSLLAQKLHKNKLSEKRKAVYLGITWVLWSVTVTAFYLSVLAPTVGTLNAAAITSDILIVVSALLYVVVSYVINKKGDNKNFIERFMVIGLSAALITLLLAIVLGFIYGAILFSMNPVQDGTPPPYSWFDVVFMLLLTLVYAYVLFKGMAVAARVKLRYIHN